MAEAQLTKLKMPNTKHWSFSIDFEKIGWLTINTKGKGPNVLSTQAMAELSVLIARIEDLVAMEEVIGVIVISGKSSGFIAGADVSEFDKIADYAQLPKQLQQAHDVFNRMEKLGVPLVSAIHGFCLGGGLELALACHYRIAVNDAKTKIGFPEVKLGIFPGFGGTGRSIRQAGPVDAMQLMLTGRYLSAKAARAQNLVDKLVWHRDVLRWEARKAVLRNLKSSPAGFRKNVMARGPLRRFVANKMRAATAKKARVEHYPAPFSLIDMFEEHGDDWREMMAGELERFPPLLLSSTSANLRRVFFLSESLKSQAYQGPDKVKFARVHVIGGGVMGGDIAAWCAFRGLDVTLQDLDIERIQPALKRAEKLFKKRLKSPTAVAAAKARIKADVKGKGVARADVVIEAVVENLRVKQNIFKDLEGKMKPDAIMATNTSSIALEKISEALTDKSRLVGLHFFNPVAQLPLVEIVRSKNNSDESVAKAASFALAIGKSPVVVNSAPGFLVNRVLMPYMLAAVERVEKGENKELLDAAAVAFGMPMGPIELMDTVGLDVGKSVAEELGHRIDEKSWFARLIQGEKLGRKKGEGFYIWRNGKPVKEETPHSENLAELGRELLQPLVDECAVCVKEGIVASADLADIGVIFGTGFAPFLGGPLKARKDGKA